MGGKQSMERKTPNSRHGRKRRSNTFTITVVQNSGRGATNLHIEDLKEMFSEKNFDEARQQFLEAGQEDKNYFIEELGKINKDLGKAFEEGDHLDFMQAVKDVNDLENIVDLFIEHGCEYFLNPVPVTK